MNLIPRNEFKNIFRSTIESKKDKATNAQNDLTKYTDQLNLLDTYYELDGDNYKLKDDTPNEVIVQLQQLFSEFSGGKFNEISDIAVYFRTLLHTKKRIILFAHNGTGKTRLSGEFHNLGKTKDIETRMTLTADTLYFNAFTEDLFYWDNDLEGDAERVLILNIKSEFFSRYGELEMDTRIRKLLTRYGDFNFRILQRDIPNTDPTQQQTIVKFYRENEDESIKISRGEENIFIWCFFLAIVEFVMDNNTSNADTNNTDTVPYSWVKYIYIDDPISSLDDNNVIAIASHLAQILKSNSKIKTIISTHHTLFFNILYYELNNAEKFYFSKQDDEYILKNTGDTPFFNHIALLQELKKVADTGTLYTYHFNILRSILEKTASFHGYKEFSKIIKQNEEDIDGIIHLRVINLLSHGNYSIFDPTIMVEENQQHFKRVLDDFINRYHFNNDLFTETGA